MCRRIGPSRARVRKPSKELCEGADYSDFPQAGKMVRRGRKTGYLYLLCSCLLARTHDAGGRAGGGQGGGRPLSGPSLNRVPRMTITGYLAAEGFEDQLRHELGGRLVAEFLA